MTPIKLLKEYQSLKKEKVNKDETRMNYVYFSSYGILQDIPLDVGIRKSRNKMKKRNEVKEDDAPELKKKGLTEDDATKLKAKMVFTSFRLLQRKQLV